MDLTFKAKNQPVGIKQKISLNSMAYFSETGEWIDVESVKKVVTAKKNKQNKRNTKNLEAYIHHCFSEILDIPDEEFTDHESFVYLGGNKIKMYQLLYKLETYLNRNIGAEIFIYCKTVSQITEYVLQ